MLPLPLARITLSSVAIRDNSHGRGGSGLVGACLSLDVLQLRHTYRELMTAVQPKHPFDQPVKPYVLPLPLQGLLLVEPPAGYVRFILVGWGRRPASGGLCNLLILTTRPLVRGVA